MTTTAPARVPAFAPPREPFLLTPGFVMSDGPVPWAVPGAFWLNGRSDRLHWTAEALDDAAAQAWAEEMILERSGGACAVSKWVPVDTETGPGWRAVGKTTTIALTLTRDDGTSNKIVYTSRDAADAAVADICHGATALLLPASAPDRDEYVLLHAYRAFTVQTETTGFFA